MSFLTGKATQPTITPERIDKNRYRAPLFFGAIAVAAAMFSIPMFLTGSTTTALAMIYLAVFIVSYAVSSCVSQVLPFSRPNILESRQSSSRHDHPNRHAPV